MKLQFDELLQKYLDEDGNIVEGVVEVEIDENSGVNYKDEFEATVDQTGILADMQQKVISTERAIINFKNQLKVLENTKKEFTDRLLNIMQQQDIWKIELNDMTITRKKSYERHTLDSERLKNEMPDIAKMYDKVSNIGESIQIKVGGTNNGI